MVCIDSYTNNATIYILDHGNYWPPPWGGGGGATKKFRITCAFLLTQAVECNNQFEGKICTIPSQPKNARSRIAIFLTMLDVKTPYG